MLGGFVHPPLPPPPGMWISVVFQRQRAKQLTKAHDLQRSADPHDLQWSADPFVLRGIRRGNDTRGGEEERRSEDCDQMRNDQLNRRGCGGDEDGDEPRLPVRWRHQGRSKVSR